MQLTSPQYISITVPPLFISASHALVVDKKCIKISAGKICWDATMKYCSVLGVLLHSNRISKHLFLLFGKNMNVFDAHL